MSISCFLHSFLVEIEFNWQYFRERGLRAHVVFFFFFLQVIDSVLGCFSQPEQLLGNVEELVDSIETIGER